MSKNARSDSGECTLLCPRTGQPLPWVVDETSAYTAGSHLLAALSFTFSSAWTSFRHSFMGLFSGRNLCPVPMP